MYERNDRGLLVQTKDGRRGRTYQEKVLINGKVPVYLEKTPGKLDFIKAGALFKEEDLTVIGFID